MWMPQLAWQRSLKELIINILFDAETFRNISDPSEDWVVNLTGLKELEDAFLEVLEVSAVSQIAFRCSVKPFREAVDVQDTITRMFPRLSERRYAVVSYGTEE